MTAPRRFLFLQGPHGPFFDRLGRALTEAGHQVRRVAFNAGDAAFWSDPASLIMAHDLGAPWCDAAGGLMAGQGITDLVLYGESRPVHSAGLDAARRLGLRTHLFEEGYLRPYWITYERSGTNGASPVHAWSFAAMQDALTGASAAPRENPATWGELYDHIWYGGLYHAYLLAGRHRYPDYRPHRDIALRTEVRLALQRLVLAAPIAAARRVRQRRVCRSDRPFHVVLMQLSHDDSWHRDGPFADQKTFVRHVIDAFVAGAPAHHRLVFKGHPLEDGRDRPARTVRTAAREAGIADRTIYLDGGKLAALLDQARSAVTVTSTAGQQALWRGVPLHAAGRAIYARPGLASDQPLLEFFHNPRPPDPKLSSVLRSFLLATSQVAGGYYSVNGRAQILRQVVDMMLADRDPYQKLQAGTGSPQLRVAATGGSRLTWP